jgi:hypothetical protein
MVERRCLHGRTYRRWVCEENDRNDENCDVILKENKLVTKSPYINGQFTEVGPETGGIFCAS